MKEDPLSEIIKERDAEIRRLRVALTEIAHTWIDIPPEDMIANLKATAIMALAGEVPASGGSTTGAGCEAGRRR